MSEQLARCPFCGSTELDDDRNFGGIAHFITCFSCRSDGPTGKTNEEAVERWNHRPIEETLRAELEHARAELAEMKGRTCKTCYRYETCHMCIEIFGGLMPVKLCSLWGPRKAQP